ncbi:HEAT repeat domain-containing protein [Prolixibacteraceae bacterium JC049]|nr:HEAT repeat domain-containing protein [Prolixibacteraceae bacterium JC049]
MTNKLNEEWIKGLHSSNPQAVLNAIEQIAEKGNSSYFPELVQVLQSNTDEAVQLRITKLLCEIKHKDIIPYLVEAIQNESLTDVREKLVASCWENGLDFCPHISVFVDIVINSGDYMVALEAFTVVENMEGNISEIDKKAEVQKVQAAIATATDDRKPFLEALISIIPNIFPAEN